MIDPERLRRGKLKAKKRRWWSSPSPDAWWRLGPEEAKKAHERLLQRARKTGQPCSCAVCGNRRRTQKGMARLTRQEIRARETKE